MPLTAKTKTEIICSLDYENSIEIRTLYPDKEDLICPECGTPVFPRSRTNFVSHFVHCSQNNNCSLSNESLEHQMAKIHVYKILKEQHPDGFVHCEYPIYQDSKLIRRADVMLLAGGKLGIAFEIQLSNISLIEIQARTNDYYANGFDVQWILGEKFSNNDVKTWLQETGGFCTIDNYTEFIKVSSADFLSHFKLKGIEV